MSVARGHQIQGARGALKVFKESSVRQFDVGVSELDGGVSLNDLVKLRIGIQRKLLGFQRVKVRGQVQLIEEEAPASVLKVVMRHLNGKRGAPAGNREAKVSGNVRGRVFFFVAAAAAATSLANIQDLVGFGVRAWVVWVVVRIGGASMSSQSRRGSRLHAVGSSSSADAARSSWSKISSWPVRRLVQR